MSFAHTKIQPPRPRGGRLLPRPRLDEPLAQALAGQRLVLVSAPAGYGKSALMAQQLQHWPGGQALAWVAMDAGDDLARLLECLVAALEPLDLPWRAAPEALMAACSSDEGQRRFVAELVNALEACGAPHGVIALDDLHRVDDAACWTFLERLIDRLGPRWTVALLTRHDPPLPLARWRAAGDMTEFRAEALRWRPDELGHWLAAAGAAPERLAALLQRTDGWAAGVQLALRSGGGGMVATERAFHEFLTGEVIDTLEPALRDFLLRVSVLPELTVARAAAVSGRADAAQLLDRVEQLDLFVTALEAPETTLKLHDLLRDTLQQRLRIEQPALVPEVLRRAAAGEPDPLRRIGWLLATGSADDAAEASAVLLDAAPRWITAGAMASVQQVLEQFDPALRERLPAWQLSQCLLAWASGRFGPMDAAAERAEVLATEAGDGELAALARAYRAIALNFLSRRGLRDLAVDRLRSRSPTPQVLAGVALAWADIDEGRFEQAREHYARTLQQLERSTEPHLWYQGHLGTVGVHIPGMGPLMERWIAGALRVCGDQPLALRTMATLTQGWHQVLVRGDLAAARRSLAATRAELRWQGETGGLQAWTTVLELLLEAAAGDAAATRRTATELLQGPGMWQGHRARWILAQFIAGCAAATGDAALLDEQVQVLAATSVDEAMPGVRDLVLDIALGQVAWLRGDVDTAAGHWRRVLADPVGAVRSRLDVPVRLFLCAAELRAGRVAAAAAPLAGLQQRSRLGAAGSMLYARPAAPWVLGHDWTGLLDAADRDELQAWSLRLQASSAGQALAPAAQWALAAAPSAPQTGAVSPEAELPGNLSAREFEVLELIAAGESNKVIARALDISPHTVKRHVANILDKLALSSRGQAAAWLRANA